MTEAIPRIKKFNSPAVDEFARLFGEFLGVEIVLTDGGERTDATQHLSGLTDARNERVADGGVSEYGEGATELMTQQTQPAIEVLGAPQPSSQLWQKGAE